VLFAPFIILHLVAEAAPKWKSMSGKRPFHGFHRFRPQTLSFDGKPDIVRI